MKATYIIFIILFVLLGVGLVIYKTYISPGNIDKPDLPLPEGQSNTTQTYAEVTDIEPEHVQYIVNELGGYKLHDDPLSKEPAIMEFYVTDTEQYYSITITDNYPEVAEGKATNPDLKIHAAEMILIELLKTKENFTQSVVERAEAGDLWIEVLADEKTLALKGYKAIYDTISTDSGMPTGRVIAALRP